MARKAAKARRRLRSQGIGVQAARSDLGPAARWARGGLAVEETMEAGRRRARVRYECLLDLLLERGDLGQGREARRRHDAGLWLRQLYQRTHDDAAIQRYDTLGRDQSAMSDEDAAAADLYRRTLLAMGPAFGVLRRVCCDDRPSPVHAGLRQGLDRLADWRGM